MGKRLLFSTLAALGLMLMCGASEPTYARRAVAYVSACTPITNDLTPAHLTCAVTAGQTLVIFSGSDIGGTAHTYSASGETFTTPHCIVRGAGTAILCGVAICAIQTTTTIDVQIDGGTAAVFDSVHGAKFTGLPTSGCNSDFETGQSPNTGDDSAAPPYTSKSFTLGAGVAGSVLVGAITANNSDAAPNNGETEISQTGVQYNISMQYHILSAASTMSWTWGANNRFNANVLEFEETAAASSFPAAIINALLRGGGIVLCVWSVRRRRDA